MHGASTIVIVRPDLSIAGGETDAPTPPEPELERRFFELVRLREPDVIVLDCRGKDAVEHSGGGAIRKIRGQCDIPIMVVCEAGDPLQREYRICGAAECLDAPSDLVAFNEAVQAIIRLRPAAHNGRGGARGSDRRAFEVGGMRFDPQRNEVSTDAASVRLTTAENQLLLHLLARPWTVCSRAEIAGMLYGPYRPSSDRAVDVVVTRLRRKLAEVGGAAAQALIKTEFRLGYMLVGEVSPLAAASTAAMTL